MNGHGYRYLVELAREKEAGPLGLHPVQLDLAPAVEWGRFRALQAWLDPVRAAAAEITIRPQWHAKAGAPYVEGLRVVARAAGAASVTAVVPLSSFKREVMQVANQLVESKKLQAGERFTYATLAFPETKPAPPAAGDGLEIEEVPVPVDLKPGSLAEMLSKSKGYGEVDAELPHVFVASRVIAEAVTLVQQANELEIGSILIGHVRKDTSVRRIFLEVTAQIPARHTLSETSKLSFTPETWSAAQAAIALRRDGEHMVGWFHSHPARYWCTKDCPPDTRAQCVLNTAFFSTADCDVQRTCFLPPYCIGLLVTHAFNGMKLAMFSWKDATIAQRGFHIINPESTTQPLPAMEAAPRIGDSTHETSCHTEPAHH